MARALRPGARRRHRAGEHRAPRGRSSADSHRGAPGPVNLLALDTATPSTVVGVLAGAAVGQERDDPSPGERPRHAQLVLALADRALRRAGLGWEDIERVGVGVGPGSFTGLRIGVATARGLAQSADVPLVGVSTLRTLAAVVLGLGTEGAGRAGGGRDTLAAAAAPGVLTALDARRGEAFGAAFRGSPAGPHEVAAAAAVSPDGLGQLVEGLPDGEGWWGVGDGAIRFRGHLEPAGVVVPPDDSSLHRVDGEALCRLAAAAPPQAWEAVNPDYLREPDAEVALRASRR